MTWHQSEVKAASSRVVIGANLYGKADDGAGVCIARAAAVDALVKEDWNVYVLVETLLRPFHPGSQQCWRVLLTLRETYSFPGCPCSLTYPGFLEMPCQTHLEVCFLILLTSLNSVTVTIEISPSQC